MTRARVVKWFDLGHVRVRVIDCPRGGVTYSFWVGDEELPERKASLFSAHVHRGMGRELHKLAAYIGSLEDQNEPAEGDAA